MIDIHIRISAKLVLFVIGVFVALLALSYALTTVGGHVSKTEVVTVETAP